RVILLNLDVKSFSCVVLSQLEDRVPFGVLFFYYIKISSYEIRKALTAVCVFYG
ncbi:MAG: hypothetical protein K0S76_1219, partial [Herbinix sp.]|nr:hypothetical protein [Herbinix sp.]